jgi:hypothetical protein
VVAGTDRSPPWWGSVGSVGVELVAPVVPVDPGAAVDDGAVTAGAVVVGAVVGAAAAAAAPGSWANRWLVVMLAAVASTSGRSIRRRTDAATVSSADSRLSARWAWARPPAKASGQTKPICQANRAATPAVTTAVTDGRRSHHAGTAVTRRPATREAM